MRTKSRVAGLAGLLFLMPCVSRGQASAKLEFEVATVRPSGPQSTGPAGARQWKSGGAGTNDPGRLTYTLMPFRYLLMDSYGVQLDRIAGPAWIDERYDIVAKVPLGTTRAEQDLMLRNLLIERYHMSVRVEAQEKPGYVLTVAKGGPKFKESVLDPALKPVLTLASCRQGKDQDGFPQVASGCRGQLQQNVSGAVRITARQVPLDLLVRALTPILNVGSERIVDETGLTGTYDYRLGFSRTGLSAKASADLDPSDLPDIFGALEKQLGLKLEPKKLTLKMVIVDHADKTPAEN